MAGFLKCECGSGEFIKWSRLRRLDSGSNAEEIGGYQCANPECLKKADLGAMGRRLELEAKAKELRELTEEVKNATPAKPEPAKAGKTEEGPKPAA